MFGRKKKVEDSASNYEVSPVVKKTSGWDVALIVFLALLLILAVVVKLNQIFHWWQTLPW